MCCLYRVILDERPSVRVVASAVDDCATAVPKYGWGRNIKETREMWLWLWKVSNLFFHMVLGEQ